MAYKFPSNPFSIVDPKDFWKSFKKRFSEDFVTLNFQKMGFRVYEPFQDIGTDRTVTKFICPTCYNKKNVYELVNTEPHCSDCKSNKIRITRFLQIKTRKLATQKRKSSAGIETEGDPYFGFTLKTKDFIPDPRIVFILFSDHTEPFDFLIFTINDYLNFMLKAKYEINHFKTPTFKFENGKINSIFYENSEKINEKYFSKGSWVIRHTNKHHKKNNRNEPSSINLSLDDYLNEEGLKRIMNPDIENSFIAKVDEIIAFKRKYFFEMVGGDTFTDADLLIINNHIKSFLNLNSQSRKLIRDKVKAKYNKLDKKIKLSIQNYEKDLYEEKEDE
jgi:hypothetical protein